jgi:hypothetical protein
VALNVSRGVLQTLVDKHFPAPDRSRIQRLLGLEAPSASSKSVKVEEVVNSKAGGSSSSNGGGFLDQEASSSAGSKRKSSKCHINQMYETKC